MVALILGWRSGAIPQISGLIGAIGGGVVAILAPADVRRPAGVDRPGLPPDRRPGRPGRRGRASASRSAAPSVAAVARRLGTGAARDGRPDRRRRASASSRSCSSCGWPAASSPRARCRAWPRRPAARPRSAPWPPFLPPPTEIAIGLGGWLDTTGLPDVFVGFEPLPAPPVDRPDDPAARAIAAAAEASTLKVSAATCGLSSVGTGFVVATSYVVTNAHVVAGADARARPGQRAAASVLDAVPVLFDPALDVALLHVDGPARSRRCTSPRRTRAAAPSARRSAIPGGGRLTIVPAAVAEPLSRRPAATSTARTASGARSSSFAPRSTGATAAVR